jgi:hypothetical protein
MKMIIEFDFKMSFRREYDWFDDRSFSRCFKNDKKWFFSLFLDSNNKRDTINDFIETQHSINVISFVIYKHDKKRFENKFFLFRDWFAFYDITHCFDSTKMNQKKFSFRVDFERSDWFIYHWKAISKIINCFD